MSYAIIQPPFTLNFREMSKQELKDYFRWFFDVLPGRIDELTRAVNKSPGYESWQPDQTPASLNALGEWFATQVETRPLTPEEIQELADSYSLPIEPPSEELTTRTLSLAIDIGMYLSQVFVKNHPSLRWEQPLTGGKKRTESYGEPVLVGFGVLSFNPVYMVVVIATGLAKKTKTGKQLREVYDIWEKIKVEGIESIRR